LGGFVEILVAVADMTVADELLRSLTWRLEHSPLAFDSELSEVRVPSDSEMGTVDLVIDTVEAWLADEGRGATAELRIGESVYVMNGSARKKASRSALAVIASRAMVGAGSGPMEPS
jgi:hypothetical protein